MPRASDSRCWRAPGPAARQLGAEGEVGASRPAKSGLIALPGGAAWKTGRYFT
jgi:hypothetical protein